MVIVGKREILVIERHALRGDERACCRADLRDAGGAAAVVVLVRVSVVVGGAGQVGVDLGDVAQQVVLIDEVDGLVIQRAEENETGTQLVLRCLVNTSCVPVSTPE